MRPTRPNGDDDTRVRLTSRADLYLCLARAFLPPVAEGHFEAIGRDLPLDLEELLPGCDLVGHFADAIGEVPDQATLLRSYSRLFLTPPYRVPLNAGILIDNGISGPSVQEMERCYQRYGLARRTDFHDSSDHLAVQLQFLAMLLNSAAQAGNESQVTYGLEEARDFVHRFMFPWLSDWVRSLQREYDEDATHRPYAILGALVRDALEDEAKWLEIQVPAEVVGPAAEVTADPVTALHTSDKKSAAQSCCGCCGRDFVPADEMAFIMQAMQQQGLDVEHLAVCPDCRTEAMSLHPVTPHFRER